MGQAGDTIETQVVHHCSIGLVWAAAQRCEQDSYFAKEHYALLKDGHFAEYGQVSIDGMTHYNINDGTLNTIASFKLLLNLEVN